MVKKPTKEPLSTEPGKWVCIVCGYQTDSDELKRRHERKEWCHNTPEKDHEMDIHPYHHE